MQQMQTLISFKRKGDNLFMLVCEDTQGKRSRFYFDMTRAHSGIFISDKEIVGTKEFCAPFDIKLAQYTTRAYIESAQVDGDNRILQFFLAQKEHYKVQYSWLVCEFTGKHTNVILCDKDMVVCEALRHIPNHKSWREVRVGKALLPLPQPANSISCENIEPQKVCELLESAYKEIYFKAKQNKKQQILKNLQMKQDTLKEHLAHLPKQGELIESALLYAHYGELIFSSLHLFSTKKIISDSVILQDINAQNVCVPLPACARDLQEAGNWYFTQSKKYNKKAQHLNKQREYLQEKIDFIASQIALVERFEDFGDVFSLSHQKTQKSSNIGARENESFFVEGFKISIGRNAKENQKLLESAKADDIWLHIRDVPSAHMIIHCGKKMPSSTLLHKVAGILVGLYVGRKGAGDFVVDWTRRRFVKNAPGAQVVYAKHKSISYRVQNDNALTPLD